MGGNSVDDFFFNFQVNLSDLAISQYVDQIEKVCIKKND